MHILLIRFSSMGDVVLQTATMNWLRSLFGKELRLTFLTAQEFVVLLERHPAIDQVIGFDRKNGEKYRDLVKKIDLLHEEHPIDLILDLHATLRSFLLRCSFWNIPNLTVDKRRWERFLLTKIKNVKLKRFFDRKFFALEPQVVRVIRDFQDIFGDGRGVAETITYRHGKHDELSSLPDLPSSGATRPYVVLAPSASFLYKRWPIDRFVALAREILAKTSYDLVVLAGKEDDFCRAFDAIQDERLRNLQGKTTLAESMAILREARLCIGNDSGMNHIAEAYEVPCVTLFGPTDPRFGFAPHGKNSLFISKDLWCKPCSTTGKTPCYRERHFCMEAISVTEVLEKSLGVLHA